MHLICLHIFFVYQFGTKIGFGKNKYSVVLSDGLANVCPSIDDVRL